MGSFIELMAVALTAMFAENFLLVNCMGIGTRLRAFRDPKDAIRTGLCLTAVMVVSTLVCWCVDGAVLRHYALTWYRTFVFALLVPGTVWAIRQFLRLFVPELFRRNDIHLRTVTTNASALGCVLLVSLRSYALGEALIFALCGGLGVTVALANFTHLLGEAELEQCPKCFRGIPIRLITAGLMAMSLVGFYGLHIV